MRIAFADFCGLDFHAGSVDVMPMGGAQSAACHLARCLAGEGHEVFLASHASAPGRYDGVVCFSWLHNDPATLLRPLKLDVLICILAAGNGAPLRNILGSQTLLILWNQHAHDEAGVQALNDARERAAYNGFAMVSDWQSEQFHRRFGLDPCRMKVLRNAIAPAFANLFSEEESILRQKAMPPALAYTSTPFRGLDLLLDSFGRVRKEVPGTRLRVYSSMRVYQAPIAQDESLACAERRWASLNGKLPAYVSRG